MNLLSVYWFGLRFKNDKNENFNKTEKNFSEDFLIVGITLHYTCLIAALQLSFKLHPDRIIER